MKPFLFSTGLFLFQGLLPAQTALVVALSNYPPWSNWPPTNAGNDVPLMVNTLLQQGFKQENIQVLQDEAATKAGIEKAIQTGLLARAAAGGTVVLHFSGHGQQVQDDNNSETDGLDEALAPYDSPKNFQPGQYRGENLLREEQLARLLEPVRQKLGPSGQLLLVIDASYNGAGSRGQQAGRGADVVMADPAFLERLRSAAPTFASDGFNIASATPAPGMAPLTLLLASTNAAPGSEPPGDDGKPVGALTYAFTKALNAAGPGDTYNDLMLDIRRIMSARAPLQIPGIEGDPNGPVPGDHTSSLHRFTVSAFDGNQQEAQIQGGMLQGVLTGSVIAFYPPGLSDTIGVRPRATGRVVAANLLNATVQVDGKAAPEKILESVAWFRRRSYGGLQASIRIEVPDKKLADRIRAQCEIMPFLRLDAGNADLQVLSTEPALLELRTREGSTLYSDSIALALDGLLVDQIRRFAQARYFRELKLDEPSLEMTLDLIPVKTTQVNRKTIEQARYPLAERTDPMGNIWLLPEDRYKIKVTNKGDRPAYYTVLYIPPDNDLQVMAPQAADSQMPATEFLLQPGESREYPRFFRNTASEGLRVLKLISSENPVDLNAVLQNKGQLLRGENARSWSAVEHFVAETFQNTAELPAIPPGAAHISTLTFTVGAPPPRKF